MKLKIIGLLAIFGGLAYGQGVTINGSRTLIGSTNVQYANAGSTGTTVNRLAKLTGAPSTAVIFGTADTNGLLGIVVAGAGTTGNAEIAVSGQASCIFDGATTAGHWVTSSTGTAGDCHDEGIATSAAPTAGIPLVGVVTTTNGGGGTYTVDMSLYAAVVGGSASGTAGGDLSGTYPNPTVARVNGISYSATAAAHSVEVITVANTTATNKVVPDCTDTGGNHLNFAQSGDTFSCGTSSAAAQSFFASCTATNPAFSATPTLSLADISTTSPCFVQYGAMTANVTSFTITNKKAGDRFYVEWTQNGTGNFTVTYGASATGTCQVDPAASASTIQGFVVLSDGTTVIGTGCYVTSSIIYGPEQAAPGTPASGVGVCWWDSTSHQRTCMDNGSSTKGVSVVPQTCTNQFFSAVAATGVFTCATASAGGGNQSRSILGGSGLTPDASGNVQFQPYSCPTGCLSSTAFFAYNVAVFADTSTLDCLYFNFPVPADYSSSATTVVFDWNTTATTGNAIWTFAYRDVSTATLAATTAQESLSATTAASGTASARTTSTFTLTGANLVVGDTVQAQGCRNGVGSDTIAASLALHDARLNYVSTY